MACSINLRTDLLQNAEPGGTWTYNGAIFISGSANPYDGNPDNITQFTTSADSVTPPDGMFPLTGDNPLITPNRNTGRAYFSLTYTVTSGSCTVSNNVVLPIQQKGCYPIEQNALNFGVSKITQITINLAPPRSSQPISLTGIVNYPKVGDFSGNNYNNNNLGRCDLSGTTGTWTQIMGSPNPHPGFSIDNNGIAWFDPFLFNYPSDSSPIIFKHTFTQNPVSGFNLSNCPECQSDSVEIIFNISDTYSESTEALSKAYQFDIPTSTNIIYDVVDVTGKKMSNDPSMGFILPFQLTFAGSLESLGYNIILWQALQYNYVSITDINKAVTSRYLLDYFGDNPRRLLIARPFMGLSALWTDSTGSSTITPTIYNTY